MAYDLSNLLVVGIASSALFDLQESDAVFQSSGEEVYRKYQEDHLDEPLQPGVAFPFVRRLLSLNNLVEQGEKPLVEVIVLSKNDPDTGLRVMRSIKHHDLPITRATFMQGRSPYKFMPAFNMALFLSANAHDVSNAVALGHPAGQVMETASHDDGGEDLRIAFDFDGVLADDSSERVMQHGGLEAFHENEVQRAAEPIPNGLMLPLLAGINRIQRKEEAKRAADPSYRIRVHVALVTARNAPSHERAILSLKNWGVTVNDAFFLGGVEKASVLAILRPHIFFDDQKGHIASAAKVVPSVHVPFGVTNTVGVAPEEGETRPATAG